MILIGDDGGYVNIFKMRRKFLVDNSSENEHNDFLTQQMLIKKDSFEKYNINVISVYFTVDYRGKFIQIGYCKLGIQKK